MRPQGRIRGSSSFKLSRNTRLQMRVQKNITSTRCAQDIEGLSEGRKFTDPFSEPARHFTRDLAGKINELGWTITRCYGETSFAPPGAQPGADRAQTFTEDACVDAGPEKHHFDYVRARYRGAVRGSKIPRSVQRADSPFQPDLPGENSGLRVPQIRLLRGNFKMPPGGAPMGGSRSNFHRIRACRCGFRKTSLRPAVHKISRGCPRVENSAIRSVSQLATFSLF